MLCNPGNRSRQFIACMGDGLHIPNSAALVHELRSLAEGPERSRVVSCLRWSSVIYSKCTCCSERVGVKSVGRVLLASYPAATFNLNPRTLSIYVSIKLTYYHIIRWSVCGYILDHSLTMMCIGHFISYGRHVFSALLPISALQL